MSDGGVERGGQTVGDRKKGIRHKVFGGGWQKIGEEPRIGTLRGGVAVACNSCLYVFRVCAHTTSGKKMWSIVTGRAGEPIGLMHSFIGNCQHQSAAGASFVRLKEIALQHDISLCLWHTQQQPCSSRCKSMCYCCYCNLELNLIRV